MFSIFAVTNIKIRCELICDNNLWLLPARLIALSISIWASLVVRLRDILEANKYLVLVSIISHSQTLFPSIFRTVSSAIDAPVFGVLKMVPLLHLSVPPIPLALPPDDLGVLSDVRARASIQETPPKKIQVLPQIGPGDAQLNVDFKLLPLGPVENRDFGILSPPAPRSFTVGPGHIKT